MLDIIHVGVRQSRHPSEFAEVGGHLQGYRGIGAVSALVLGGHGGAEQHGTIAVPPFRLG